MSISVRHVSKSFGTFVALNDVSVDIPSGTLTALLGPSGGGKSTLLRIIAGLETPDSGTVEISGTDSTTLPPQRRNVGFVFQHYAAFRHMTVAKNVAFGLEVRRRPRAETRRRVQELLELVHLEQFAHRYPSELSGGQRQRMALARALAVEPQVLLLDEPFGALDAQVRKELRTWLRRLHDEVHVTTVFVTHDQEEAMEVADEIVVINRGAVEPQVLLLDEPFGALDAQVRKELRTWLRRLHDEVHVTTVFVTHDQEEAMEVADEIVVINRGAVEQVGTPDQLYDEPATDFVMTFLGPVTRLAGRVVRPHDLELSPRPVPGATGATVARVVRLGFEVRVDVRTADEDVWVQLTRGEAEKLGIEVGSRVFVQAPPDVGLPAAANG